MINTVVFFMFISQLTLLAFLIFQYLFTRLFDYIDVRIRRRKYLKDIKKDIDIQKERLTNKIKN